MIIDSIKKEYQRYKVLGEGAIRQVSDSEINNIIGDENNSITIVIRHISGNLKSRFTDFLTSDGEKSWRNREDEFDSVELDKTELMKVWEEGWTVLFDTLEPLTDKDLSKTVKIRGIDLLVHAALHRSLVHTSYHVGQIVILARIFTGEKWESLSIPKGKSSQYNKTPTKE